MNSSNSSSSNSTATQKMLTAVLALQTLTLLGMWTGQPSAAPASAAIPDPGAQREALVVEQRATNQKLDTLIELLKSGDVKVKAKVEDDAKKK